MDILQKSEKSRLSPTFTDNSRDYFWKEFGIDIEQPDERVIGAEASFKFFCYYYLGHHLSLPPADFHDDLIKILEDTEEKATGIIGYRGCAKSTFASLAYPLWCAIFRKYHFIIIINDTTPQMRINVLSMKTELEENPLIASDFPAVRSVNKWTEEQLLLSSGALIMGRSRGQKIRGLKWRQFRPDVVICDDLESLEWVRTKENRDKTARWFKSEVVPAMDELKAKVIVLGNLLHKDAFMSRMKRWQNYKVVEYPLIDKDGYITWTGKYPNAQAIEKKRLDVDDNVTWSREYLLKVISEDEQVIKEEDIVYYSNERLTTTVKHLQIRPHRAGIGIDLAISEKQTADYTSMIAGISSKENDAEVIYILPNPVNKRLDLHNTVLTADALHRTLPLGSRIFVENVAYQQAAIKEMTRKGLPAIGIRPIGDKRARLETIAMYVKRGIVRFPRTGCEDLITQLVGFGVEEHDDMVDAFVYFILGLIDKKRSRAGVGKGDTI